MKIALIGNCMAPGLGMALRQIANDLEVFAFEAREVQRADLLKSTEDLFKQCDFVFSQNLPASFGDLGYEKLREVHPRAHRIPSGAFTGFHPDCVYFIHKEQQYSSPLGAYNSAIAAAAFGLGLDLEKTLSLFGADIYRRLGYFDEFAKARRFLAHDFQLCGLDLEAAWPSLRECGVFAHTINHPKGCMVAAIAKLMAVKIGAAAPDAPVPELAYDVLSSNAIWPVYPEIAAAIGVRGHYLFKRPGGPDFIRGGGVFHDLREFVALSFKKYADYPKEAFAAPNVARIGALLKDLV